MSNEGPRSRALTSLLRLSFGVASKAATPATEELARFLREKGLVDLEVRAAPSYKELAANVRGGSTDVAWLGPVAYAWIAEGVTPIGAIRRKGTGDYKSALVVRDDSPIAGVSALATAKDLRAGWVDPWSAAGYVVPRLELARRKIFPTIFASEKFYGSHRAVLEALRDRACDIGAVYASAVSEIEVDSLRVRVLATAGPIPSDVIAVRRNLAPKDYETIRDAFRAACADETGRERLRDVFDGDELDEELGAGHTNLRLAYETGVASGLFD